MFKKNAVIKTAAAVFCVGVLFGGIGTGVAIAEYTSLEYTGEHILGAEHIKTENVDVEIVPKEGKKIQIWRHHRVDGVHYGEDIPMNTIRYVVTYNTELVNIWVDYEEYETEADTDDERDQYRDRDDRYQGHVRLDYYYTGNEVDLLMRNKDKILEELKHGQVGFYRAESIQSIKIWMNPGMREFVEFS